MNRISTFRLLRVDGISETSPKSTSASGISPPSATNPTDAPAVSFGMRSGPAVSKIRTPEASTTLAASSGCTSRLATWVWSSSGLAVVVSDATMKS